MDLSPASIGFGIIFGCMGFATLQVGRRRDDPKKIVVGVCLIGMTFLIGGEWWAWLAGTVALAFAWLT